MFPIDDNHLVTLPQAIMSRHQQDKLSSIREVDSSAPSLNELVIFDKEPAQITVKTYLAIFTVCLIYFAQLVNLVGAGAQSQQIAIALGDPDRSIWITSSIAIATAVLSPIISQAADYWGRKWFLVVLTSLGAVGSLIVSQATSMDVAIMGFAITGLSYGVQPLLHVVSSEVLPRRYRPFGQAADLVANAFGGITGLLVGGVMSKGTKDSVSFGYRNFWYMCMALFLLATILTPFLYNPPPTPKQRSLTTLKKLAQLDWIGYSLFASGLVLFSVGLSYSENPYPWSDGHVSATFAIGLVLSIAACVYEIWFIDTGMFHHEIFRQRNFAIALACIFCEGAAFFAANQYFAFQASVLYKTPTVIVGLKYSLTMMVSIPAALIAGIYCTVTKTVRWLTVLAFLVFVGFFVGMATLGLEDSNKLWGYPVLLGAALGTTLCALITVAQLSTPPELIAIASGLIISIRSLGGAVALAIYNALFANEMNHLGQNIGNAVVPLGLPTSVLPRFLEAFISHSEQDLSNIPGVTPEILKTATSSLLNTYLSAFKHIWIVASCFVAVAAVMAIFLIDPSDEFTMDIDAPIDRDHELHLISSLQ